MHIRRVEDVVPQLIAAGNLKLAVGAQAVVAYGEYAVVSINRRRHHEIAARVALLISDTNNQPFQDLAIELDIPGRATRALHFASQDVGVRHRADGLAASIEVRDGAPGEERKNRDVQNHAVVEEPRAGLENG